MKVLATGSGIVATVRTGCEGIVFDYCEVMTFWAGADRMQCGLVCDSDGVGTSRNETEQHLEGMGAEGDTDAEFVDLLTDADFVHVGPLLEFVYWYFSVNSNDCRGLATAS